MTQSGAAVSARNAAWNGSLAPGATVTFGFLASGTGSPAPEVSCTTG
ncbi:cellulose binding domain-containing protein [Streptosporangium sp. H16]